MWDFGEMSEKLDSLDGILQFLKDLARQNEASLHDVLEIIKRVIKGILMLIKWTLKMIFQMSTRRLFRKINCLNLIKMVCKNIWDPNYQSGKGLMGLHMYGKQCYLIRKSARMSWCYHLSQIAHGGCLKISHHNPLWLMEVTATHRGRY